MDRGLLAPDSVRRAFVLTLGLVATVTSTGVRGAETIVRVSSLGFRSGSRKTATFLKGGRFTVRRAADDAAVFSAVLDTPIADRASGQAVYVGDFSSVTTPGDYYLELASCERSPTFPIAPDVYLDAYRTMMLGF